MCRLLFPRVGRVGKNFPCSPEVSQTATDKFFNTSNCSALDDVTEKHAMFETFKKLRTSVMALKILAPPKFWLFREIYKAVSRTREIKLIDF